MSLPRRPSVYDQLRPRLDAADVVQRLGLAQTRRLGSELYCNPLCHESTSKESLQVNLHTGRWNCKACQHQGVRGDLFQLVEYVLTGGRVPSHGDAQKTSQTHRDAVLWLCQQYGIAFDADRIAGDPALDVVHMFAMAAHEFLLEQPFVLEWIQRQWGFDRATVEAYGIGYMPSPILPALAEESQRPASRSAFKTSGLGWYNAKGKWQTRFEGRVLFPYLEHGRAVYLIGRSTPWTPPLDGGRKSPKYHKLSVHSETRPYISERITNDHLYNEPVMGAATEVIIAEGVADAVALSSLGAPVVSPVTISFNATDFERFTRKARESGISRVEILFDNELSGSGNYAARRVGAKLVESGLVTRILTLPLGTEQQIARDEVIRVLGEEVFAELERSDPRDRKQIIADALPNEQDRAWVAKQMEASKIDAAEWCAQRGAGAAGKFDAIRNAGADVIDLEIADIVAAGVDEEQDAAIRAQQFASAINLAAHIEDSFYRAEYAGRIAKAAGKGITKADVQKMISQSRRTVVAQKREASKVAEKIEKASKAVDLILLPPEAAHTQPVAPPAPNERDPLRPVDDSPPAPGAPAAPAAPTKKEVSEHQRYAPVRDAVAKSVEAKMPIEQVGEYVAQTITVSMGYTPFRTPDELYLVRGSERVPVGLGKLNARFETLIFLASGLTAKKTSHRAYIAAVVYFLENNGKRADDVSWSHVSRDGSVFFPTGDPMGRIVKIEKGKVVRTRMAEVRVPAVAGTDFTPFTYVEEDGGIQRAYDIFRWTSISASDRLVLVYWIVCLPILRKIRTVPIVRIEGGSGSGKTRAVEAVSFLVNGCEGSSVPTAAAIVSRMSTEMLTVDDNRESNDISPSFLGTLLQATHLGAREKRKVNSDTGTVIERVCGALLMNGVEPIHDGKSELASRILTLRCDPIYRSDDSPAWEGKLHKSILECRDAFWSQAVRACATALELDEEYGEHIGEEIEELFGETKIGRLSAYLRMMYLAWCSTLSPDRREVAVLSLAPVWRDALEHLGQKALDSLLREELAVSALRYAFAWGAQHAEGNTGSFGGQRVGLDGKYVETDREAFLGPMRATHLARIVREAGKAMNAPQAIAYQLRAGQLEHRILDGQGFIEAAGFQMRVEETSKGHLRFTFRRGSGGESEPTVEVSEPATNGELRTYPETAPALQPPAGWGGNGAEPADDPF